MLVNCSNEECGKEIKYEDALKYGDKHFCSTKCIQDRNVRMIKKRVEGAGVACCNLSS